CPLTCTTPISRPDLVFFMSPYASRSAWDSLVTFNQRPDCSAMDVATFAVADPVASALLSLSNGSSVVASPPRLTKRSTAALSPMMARPSPSLTRVISSLKFSFFEKCRPEDSEHSPSRRTAGGCHTHPRRAGTCGAWIQCNHRPLRFRALLSNCTPLWGQSSKLNVALLRYRGEVWARCLT